MWPFEDWLCTQQNSLGIQASVVFSISVLCSIPWDGSTEMCLPIHSVKAPELFPFIGHYNESGYEHLCTSSCVCISLQYPETQLLSHMVVAFSFLKRTVTLFSVVAAPFYIPASNVWVIQCPHPCQHLVLLVFSIFDGYVVLSHYVLTCISLMANDFGKMVSVLIGPLHIFWGEISLPVFCWFSNGIVYLFVLQLKSLWLLL